jgi:hypothetical protein
MPTSHAAVQQFVRLAGERAWAKRLAELDGLTRGAGLSARALQQRHAAELLVQRIRSRGAATSGPERAIASLLAELVAAAAALPSQGRERLRARLHTALSGEGTLIALLHLAATARIHRAQGFAVSWTGLAENAPHDLLLQRDGRAMEVACDIASAEEGRWVHRGDWFALVDRLNPDLQAWLAAHPGRYLLKMTLPEGLAGPAALPELHRRVMAMLRHEDGAGSDPAVVLKLDPLVLAAAADQAALAEGLRAQFGHEAHLAVTQPPQGAAGSLFVMAARAGRENEVAVAIARRFAPMTRRLSGRLPGILSMLIEDTDRTEWLGLRDRLEIEGAARQFLTGAEARAVVCVQCLSRLELFGQGVPGAAPEGRLRFRNPRHPAAKDAALAPAILSTM